MTHQMNVYMSQQGIACHDVMCQMHGLPAITSDMPAEACTQHIRISTESESVWNVHGGRNAFLGIWLWGICSCAFVLIPEPSQTKLRSWPLKSRTRSGFCTSKSQSLKPTSYITYARLAPGVFGTDPEARYLMMDNLNNETRRG